MGDVIYGGRIENNRGVVMGHAYTAGKTGSITTV